MADTPVELEKVDLSSHHISEEKLRSLLQLFPEIRDENGKLNLDRLKQALGIWVESGRERYGMVWPGKADCMQSVQRPTFATLRPSVDESINFETSENLILEGDNLEVLKLLQKSYIGRVKFIYIDPPYNTGNDFIYPDNYAESLQTYLEYTGQVDSGGKKFGTNTDTDGRFHSKWLNMMYPRLYLGRNLLREDGVIAISIGERELSNLLYLCGEIFGEENRVTVCSRVMKTGGQKGVHFSPCVDYVVVVAKNIDELAPFRKDVGQNVIDKVYTKVAVDGPRKGENYRTMGLYQAMLEKRANQRYYIECPDGELVIPPGDSFPENAADGKQVKPNDGDGVWRWTYSRFSQEKTNHNVEFIRSDRTALVKPDGSSASWNVYYRIWLKDRLEDGQLPGNILEGFESRHSSAELKQLDIPFEFAKPVSLLKLLMTICGVKAGDLSLDFFAGSGSLGQAALELASEKGWKCPFICVQLPEKTGESSSEYKAGFSTIADICKERIRRVIAQLNGKDSGSGGMAGELLDRGFRVFKLAESNFRSWNADVPHTAERLLEQLELHLDHIVAGREEADLLYEVLLKSGFPLTTKVESLTVASKSVFSVAGGALLICFESDLTLELIRAVADARPERVVFLERGFENNDGLKANAVHIFRSKGVENFKTI